MAEMTLRLRVNPETGKKDIIISLRSDEDALPHEHEQLHKRLVEKLIEDPSERGELIIEREEEERIPPITQDQQQAQEQRQAQGQGG